MFVTKTNRLAVYSYLFKEGVLVCKKDNFKPKHDEIDVPNLEVMNLMKSFNSRGLVRETFNWQYYYYYLTNEGIEYLREYLHLPAEVVPATLKKPAPKPARPGPGPGGERGESRFGDKGKRMGPAGDFNPEYAGGFGRGGQDGYRGGGGFDRGQGGFGRGGGGN